MEAPLSQALAVAAQVAGQQQFPKPALYVVATPIGNLADLSLRALHTLALADAVACEDTRHTQHLLAACGLAKPLLAVHEHNEIHAATGVIERLRQGQRVAYVSDAGTPAVSDPGARLVAAVRAGGWRVVPLPGASSVTAALSAAGVVAGATDDSGFVFAGFLPARGRERETALNALAGEARCVVLLEAPHRIELLARGLKPFGERPVTLAREITKQFEQIETLRCDALADWLDADPMRLRGEFVVVLHPAPATARDGGAEAARVLELLLQELPLKTAAQLAAKITGQGRNDLYQMGLRMKGKAGGD